LALVGGEVSTIHRHESSAVEAQATQLVSLSAIDALGTNLIGLSPMSVPARQLVSLSAIDALGTDLMGLSPMSRRPVDSSAYRPLTCWALIS